MGSAVGRPMVPGRPRRRGPSFFQQNESIPHRIRILHGESDESRDVHEWVDVFPFPMELASLAAVADPTRVGRDLVCSGCGPLDASEEVDAAFAVLPHNNRDLPVPSILDLFRDVGVGMRASDAGEVEEADDLEECDSFSEPISPAAVALEVSIAPFWKEW